MPSGTILSDFGIGPFERVQVDRFEIRRENVRIAAAVERSDEQPRTVGTLRDIAPDALENILVARFHAMELRGKCLGVRAAGKLKPDFTRTHRRGFWVATCRDFGGGA